MENLASKYRPKTWNEICGQEAVVKILNKQLETSNIKNTYIFSGASGCGKTTVARLFANKINKHKGSPIEIDAASNNGVDNVKQIVNSASERAIDSEYKIYIIDEAHMISTAGWNAFLKCIEEPPTYTIFIFCTTDPQKIPDTIKNRCMRFNFTRIPSELIRNRLVYVCEEENFINYNEACDYISRICKGEMRNALSLLETCADYNNNLEINNVVKALGNFSYDTFFNIINGIFDGRSDVVLSEIDGIYNSGADLKIFVNSFLEFCLDMTKYILTNSMQSTKLPSTCEDKVMFAVGFENASKYYFYVIDKLLELKNMLKTDVDLKPTVEVVFSQMCRLV